MNEIFVVEEALRLIDERISTLPSFELYKTIKKQLEYLLSVLDGSCDDANNLEKIVVGHYAVHEFEETDPELSNLLKKCQKIVFDRI
ncbi:immunity protein Tsi6 family protein [Thalassolituus sp.]|jgi:hypothetical protein|uniref:immunity protein Tsi6 family protein n=1 Tax=Thalassolituus sp. TaxID=2030822 RepID=UPI0035111473